MDLECERALARTHRAEGKAQDGHGGEDGTPATSYRADVIGHDLELALRLVVGTFACATIGAEREARGHEAGLRTFGLVGLGSAALVTLSLDAFPNSTDKVVAGIITGIGFLGAGMLIRSGSHIRNLTSAAASWASAALGSVFGAGRYVLGAVMGVLALVLLEIPFVPGLRRLDPAGREGGSGRERVRSTVDDDASPNGV